MKVQELAGANHFANKALPSTADEWIEGTNEVSGSWWPRWDEWLSERSGAMKNAPKSIGNKAYPPLAQAPGEYVFT